MHRWTQGQFLSRLTSVAKHLHQQQQVVFSVEDLQPDWLPDKQQRLYRWSLRLVGGLLIGLVGGQDSRIRPAKVVT